MEKEIYAIAVFTDVIKGTVKFSEDVIQNRIKIELNIWSLKRSLRTLSQTKKKQSRLVRHSQKNLTSREVRPTGKAPTTALWSRIKVRFLVKFLICVRLRFGECYNVVPERHAFIPLISKMEFFILNSC